MKKVGLLSWMLLLLLTSCDFNFIKILQPDRAGTNQSISYPITLSLSGSNVLSGTGTLMISLPAQMTMNVESSDLVWKMNGKPIQVTVTSPRIENDQIIYSLQYTTDSASTNQNYNVFEGYITLNTGNLVGDFSISYKVSSMFATEGNKEMPIQIIETSGSDALRYGRFFKTSGYQLEDYSFYIRRENPGNATVRSANIYLVRSNESDRVAPLHSSGINDQDFYATFDGLVAGDYDYYVKFILSDNSERRYPLSGTLAGPQVNHVMVYALPFIESFEANSPSISDWHIQGRNPSWEIGVPSTDNQVGTQAFDGTGAMGTSLTSDGLIKLSDTSFIFSPIFNVGGEDSVVINYQQLTSIIGDESISQNLLLQVTSDFNTWHTVAEYKHNTKAGWETSRSRVDQFLEGSYMQLRWKAIDISASSSPEGVIMDLLSINPSLDYAVKYELSSNVELLQAEESCRIASLITNKGKLPDSYILDVDNSDGFQIALTDKNLNPISTTSILDPGDSLEVYVSITAPKNTSFNKKELRISVQSKVDPSVIAAQTISIVLDAPNGGPDVFGYTWVNSLDSTCPLFDWVNTTHHQLIDPVSIDDFYWTGFDFNFYGQVFDQYYLGAHGNIYFTAGDKQGNRDHIPSISGIQNFISFLGGYAEFDEISYGFEENIDGGAAQVITYTNMYDISSKTSDDETMDVQIILKQCGDIKLQYRNISPGFRIENAIVGIENQDGTDGLEYQYGVAKLRNQLVVEFRHPYSNTFRNMTPLDNVTDRSQFEVLRWKNPRNVDSISVYIRKDDAAFTKDDIAYYGTSINRIAAPHLEAHATYFWQIVAHQTVGTTESNIRSFTTSDDAVMLYGNVYAEDSTTLLSHVPVECEVQYQMATEWYFAKDTSKTNGAYVLNMPKGASYELSAYKKGYQNYFNRVYQITMDEDNTKEQKMYLQSEPMFTSFSFETEGEFVTLIDSFVYVFVDYDVDMTALAANYTLPVAVSSSMDLSQNHDYSDTVKVLLETSRGLKKQWSVIVQQRPDLSMYDKREIKFLHGGQQNWTEKKMNFYISSSNFVYHQSGIGMWPAFFTCTPDTSLDKMVYAEFVMEEGCGVGCTNVFAKTGDDTTHKVNIVATTVRPYSMDMIAMPADSIFMSSFEAMIYSLCIWVDTENPIPINTAPESKGWVAEGQQRKVGRGDTVRLDGTQSFDTDGDSLSYHWFSENEEIQIIDSSSPNAKFIAWTAPIPNDIEPYTLWKDINFIYLVVSDGITSDTSMVDIGVKANVWAPIVEINDRWHVDEGKRIQLSVSKAYDPDLEGLDPLTYSVSLDWKIDDNSLNINTSSDSASLIFDAPYVKKDTTILVYVRGRDAYDLSSDWVMTGVSIRNVYPSMQVETYLQGSPVESENVALYFINSEDHKGINASPLTGTDAYALYPGKWKVYAIPVDMGSHNFIPSYAQSSAISYDAQEFVLGDEAELSIRMDLIPYGILSGVGSISGKVNTEINGAIVEEMARLGVVIYSLPDTIPVSFTRTDEDGKYTFGALEVGKYLIAFDFPGMPLSQGIVVEITASQPSVNVSDITLNPQTGIDEISGDAWEIVVFPNPSTNMVYLKGLTDRARYQIYSISGVCVKTGSCTQQIPISDLDKGMYLLKINTGSTWKSMPLVKQ